MCAIVVVLAVFDVCQRHFSDQFGPNLIDVFRLDQMPKIRLLEPSTAISDRASQLSYKFKPLYDPSKSPTRGLRTEATHLNRL